MKNKGGRIKNLKIDEKDQQILELTQKQKEDLPDLWKQKTKANQITVLSFFVCLLWGLRIQEAAALCKDDFTYEKGKDNDLVRIEIKHGKGNKQGYAFAIDPLSHVIFNFIKSSSSLPYYIFFTNSEQASIKGKSLEKFKSKCSVKGNTLSM